MFGGPPLGGSRSLLTSGYGDDEDSDFDLASPPKVSLGGRGSASSRISDDDIDAILNGAVERSSEKKKKKKKKGSSHSSRSRKEDGNKSSSSSKRSSKRTSVASPASEASTDFDAVSTDFDAASPASAKEASDSVSEDSPLGSGSLRRVRTNRGQEGGITTLGEALTK